ncbi:hypothetical protein BV22DRAFT_1013320 [Leucogyrophana mollusca]|uniref:Uncharacterized protein n=1 Tax=Leucogyrophana mollusca TaxID=85980 RepID=A0ACB8BFT2_9AGAM|nr:hypothetical protein BV22DRAFT_1013320 [Leucogyrophana mollusca]
MSFHNTCLRSIQSLEYIITHVFCPLKLPLHDDHSVANDLALSDAVLQSALVFREHLLPKKQADWDQMERMLENLSATAGSDILSVDTIESQMQATKCGDVLVFLIRAQNAAVVLRELDQETIFESFEVSPTAVAVMGATGKLLCSYPGPAISVPNSIVHDATFRAELANFLARMNEDVLDAAATTTKAGSVVIEERDTTHPRYITSLLTAILRGLGKAAEIPRIRKRIGDDVQWHNARLPWRRSSFWLVIRVALQTSLVRMHSECSTYKTFLLFFMAQLTERALERDLPNEILYFMSAKISRRLAKLGSSASSSVTSVVQSATREVRKKLEARWLKVQEVQAASPDWAPESLDFEKDTNLSLLNSRSHLSSVLSGENLEYKPTTFHPTETRRRTSISDFFAGRCCYLAEAYEAEPFVALSDFESAVESGIDNWVSQVHDADSACLALEDSMSQYSTAALKHYSENPDNSSIMLLTLLELWIALDKVVVGKIPLLSEYQPEVPVSLLNPILLHNAEKLSRLDQAQQYLTERHSRANRASVFSDELSDECFAVRFFSSSPAHQTLESRIERDATAQRNAKMVELHQKNQRHAALTRQAHTLGHTQCVDAIGDLTHQAKKCQKCRLEAEIRGLKISVHEWPLPRNHFGTKIVVFELDCPLAFDVWRTATFRLLLDVCTPPLPDARLVRPEMTLRNYKPLVRYSVPRSNHRTTLASSTKPFIKSHYRTRPIPATSGDICVNNGLQFKYFDDVRHGWASDAFQRCDVSGYSTFTLPQGPYQHLQYSVAGTTHTSNDVISDQYHCHKDLTLNEFIAFGSLRSGSLLQWLNIVRELRARTLSYRREEVHLLILQTIWQVGPLLGNCRPWHEELNCAAFGNALLDELADLMAGIEANWLEALSMKTITVLTSRLLTATQNAEVRSSGYSLLLKVRETTFQCLQELSSRLQSADDVTQNEFQSRVREMAATCRSTYCLEANPVDILLQSTEDVEILVYCSIMVYDHTPPDVGTLSTSSRVALDQDRRLSHSLEHFLRQRIGECPEGLDRAITRVWPAYRVGSPWRALDGSNCRWLTSRTAAQTNQQSQMVHYNLLDGRLLIDGRPLGRLPLGIVRHPTYSLVFGSQVLDVVPGDMAGMDFATKSYICGFQVYLNLRNDGCLQIRAKHCATSQVLELIPAQEFAGDLPQLLIEDHTHWLDLTTGELEIRPVARLWEQLDENWRICFSARGPSKMRRNGSTYMLDVRSRTWEMISARLGCIEPPQYLLITWNSGNADPSLSIDLPRFRLSFFVDSEGELQSGNICDMVVDVNQSSGTMFGLASQLVLRPKAVYAEEFRHRCVIIPMGSLTFKTEGHHICVSVIASNSGQRTFQLYDIDTELGYLHGNASLTSKLYKTYLHAVTSSCLPDPLTGCTGTEEALNCLRSAECRSFMFLTPGDAELLHQIDMLTPKRTFYPAHLKKMQNVEWSCLTSTTQHVSFHGATKMIQEYSEELQSFRDQSSPATLPMSTSTPCRNYHLLERASVRSAAVYPSECMGDLPCRNRDEEYKSRDITDTDSRTRNIQVSEVADLVRRWPSTLKTTPSLLDRLVSWQHLEGVGQEVSLRYSQDWLQPPLPKTWISVYELCRRSSKAQIRYKLAFTLSAMVYGSPSSVDLASTIVAFATKSQFRNKTPPSYPSYNLLDGFQPSEKSLRGIFSACTCAFQDSPDARMEAHAGEGSKALRRRRLLAFQTRSKADEDNTVTHLLAHWPSSNPGQLPNLDPSRYNVSQLLSQAKGLFASCFRNLLLKRHLAEVQKFLDGSHHYNMASSSDLAYVFSPSRGTAASRLASVSLDQLFGRPAPELIPAKEPLSMPVRPKSCGHFASSAGLQDLISEFQASPSSRFHSLYGTDFDRSRECLEREALSALPDEITCTRESLVTYYSHCRGRFFNVLDVIRQRLSYSTPVEEAVFNSGQWPHISARVLLRQLASTSPTALTKRWKKTLVCFAEAAVQLQRARRLLSLAIRNNVDEFYKELQNTGCEGWDAEMYPDWLLIQVESNFLVRRVQADVALQMMSPTSGANTTLQLNMGEGKSSVIVPIASSALADGKKLVRVVVLKPLVAQMFQLLVERLGGLSNRRIFYLPFSRSTSFGKPQVQLIQRLMEECMRVRGILVVQPDHVLSYKLMAIHQQVCAAPAIAAQMLESQRWLDLHTRDILDESDEILHVRYQLVYTVGLQRHLEGHPDRWTTTCQLLSLASTLALGLHQRRDLSLAIEVEGGSSETFPHVRLHRHDVGLVLVREIAKCILAGRLPNYSFDQAPSHVRRAIFNFISEKGVEIQDSESVKQFCEGSELWNGLLLLRGLLACGILVYALKERRWRVDYGLDPRRTMLAVPYRAKDVPSPRAEFGHPDVAVCLTCLSYYYGGLSEAQLITSFQLLLKVDNAELEYESWVRLHRRDSIPEVLRRLSGINVESVEQRTKHLIPLFQHNQAVINFFLSQVVFPKEAKEFPQKLTCSGWDLAAQKHHFITGFSGTNDNRYLLPTSITQHDPEHQLSTNARVLAYLLQPENRHYCCAANPSGERPSANQFLGILVAQEPEIQVLLDVGAQMLELRNKELVARWLELKPNTQAAIYFNENDELTVLSRDGNVELLVSSQFAQRPEQCVLYLDDAHTRGTDVKLPRGFRAAVTLGPKVTKDRLIQGCMRMRKLGNGHSVMFFAPLEVDRGIRRAALKNDTEEVEVLDILRWTMLETCTDIQHRVSQWAQQGVDHRARHEAWSSFSSKNASIDTLESSWLQNEARSLEEMYGPDRPRNHISLEIPEIRDRCLQLGVASLSETRMDEEQEREVVHEIERERQVQRPRQVPAALHQNHSDVANFISSGRIPCASTAFFPAFDTLARTTAAFPESHAWSSNLLVTRDFASTVQAASYAMLDDYLRPAQWILSSATSANLVFISPHEANCYLPNIRTSAKVHLHMYTPRISQAMRACDDLRLYCIPPLPEEWTFAGFDLLIPQLDLFAGQLYLQTRQDYLQLCGFLGVFAGDPELKDKVVTQSDGFIKPEHRVVISNLPQLRDRPASPFQKSPLSSLNTLISIRRKGMAYLPTHLGKLLHGRLLTEGDFEY